MNKGPSNLPNDPFGGWEAERRHFIRAGDGTRILVRDDGPLSSSEGGHVRTPILCLPGLSRTGTDFQKLVDRYGRQVRILRPDMRGRGGSAWAKDPLTYRPETYLDDIRHVLAALGVHKVRVVGTSLGGLLAMGMSISQPTVLEAALLNDIGPYIPTTGTQNIAAYLDATTPQKDWASAIAHL
ncbi:MAG: alpha/beta fold hydrolase, partial [Rhodospirillaceae bacterium]